MTTNGTTAGAMPEIAEHEPAIASSKAKRMYLILGGAVLLLLIGYGIYAFVSAGKATTDDAQVAADIVPVAARVAGQVTTVYITENQPVHAGQPIADLDPSDAQVKVAQAEGDLATAQAQAADADARTAVTSASARGALTSAQGALQSSRESVDSSAGSIAEAHAAVTRATANAQKARLDFQRAEELGGKGDISKAQVDAARAAHEAADADLAQARARLSQSENARQAAQANVQTAQGRVQQSAPVQEQISAAQAQARLAHARIASAEAVLRAAQLNLSYTKILAPRDGIASKLAVHPGSYVTAGMPVVQVVPKTTYILANFKETQMADMHPGQRASIRIDALGRRDFEGKVESLSGGTGASFSLLPPDNASGNFVKVVQRVPVRISWSGPPADQIAVGSSAEVTVYTK
ncbi:MAG: rane fusion protein multidrug efflux system [Thermoanaerobaculia bacterium]|jgi:membrane fusion protein (multidrug efflux system)|nr:rane fusion protein multidrug efflux system [Thermoanaerobaculia bacterium]